MGKRRCHQAPPFSCGPFRDGPDGGSCHILFRDKPVFRAYLDRLAQRPAFQRFVQAMAAA